MIQLDRRNPKARGSRRPTVESLEGRALLTASPMARHALAAAVEVPRAHQAVAHHAGTVHALAHRATPVAHHAAAGTAARAHPIRPTVHFAAIRKNTAPGVANATPSPIPGAYSPAQLRTAYGVNLLGLANQGQGVTVAIVDQDVDPTMIPDANVYSTTYGLPQFNTAGGPSLTVVTDSTFGAVPNSSQSPTTGDGDTSGETSLDVDMVHAMAPQANIVMVFYPSSTSNANYTRNLLHAMQLGAQQTGVVAVSASYGITEGTATSTTGKAEIGYNTTYLATGAAANIAVTVSSGDSGVPPGFPATSPNVIAVGGTALYTASARGGYSFESAWGGLSQDGAAGGGVSKLYSTRNVPDISMEADPATGVSVYDSWDQAYYGSPWNEYGGTSVAAPLFAGVVSLAQQDRLNAGLGLLNSSQIDAAMFAGEASTAPAYFHDVTIGNNSNITTRGTTAGYAAAAGYDLATGIGSPIANKLVPYLAAQ